MRALARAQLTTVILDVAREQLAAHGPSGLSLRAVAREVGMASSAIYRYFDSRDALLTALIIDAYHSLGEAVETAEAVCDRKDLAGRWRALAFAVRSWARESPHLYSLVYGSPVPGYAAPSDTFVPAIRATRVLGGIVADRAAGIDGHVHPWEEAGFSEAATEAIEPLLKLLGVDTPPELALRAFMAWTCIFGYVSFELFGQLYCVIEPEGREEVFAKEVERFADWLCLG